jgi:tRNA (cmo5U34)-methyltransferase
MQRDAIKTLFDQQAAGYDDRWAKTAPIRDALHFLMRAVFARLPADARVLCVGAGTGDEIVELATRFPGWRFVAVEPSGAMLDLCRRKAEAGGFADRCRFHEGFLDTLPAEAPFDAATCVLVSQFILDRDARIGFFRGIADRLRHGGLLASADLAADVASPEYEALLRVWLDMLLSAGVPAAGLEQMRQAYARDVAILPPAQVASLIRAAGFDTPVLFHQAGLIHAWFSTRA